MIVHPFLLVFVLLARTGNAGNVHFPFLKSPSEIPPTPGPKPKLDRNPTHISDFTDPDTGLNPFLDLQEGRTEAFGRRVMEQDRPAPKPPAAVPNFDIEEGGAEDRGRPPMGGNGMPPLGPRWKGGRDSTSANDYQKPTPSRKGTESSQRSFVDHPSKTFDFSAFTEGNPFLVTEDALLRFYTESPVTLSTSIGEDEQQPVRFVDDVKHLTSDDVEHVTSKPENPFLATTNVTMISALVTGAGVALLALAVAVCWKQRTNRTRTQTQLPYESNTQDVESAADQRNCYVGNSDKQKAVESILRK